MKSPIGFLLVFFTLSVASLYADGQGIDAAICDTTSRFPITKYAEHLRTEERISIDSVLSASNAFVAARDEPVMVVEYDPYYYWFRIVVQNKLDKPRQL